MLVQVNALARAPTAFQCTVDAVRVSDVLLPGVARLAMALAKGSNVKVKVINTNLLT